MDTGRCFSGLVLLNVQNIRANYANNTEGNKVR